MSARPALVQPDGTVRTLRSAAAPLGLGTAATAATAELGTAALPPPLGLGAAASAATRVGTTLVATARSCALQDEKGPRR